MSLNHDQYEEADADPAGDNSPELAAEVEQIRDSSSIPVGINQEDPEVEHTQANFDSDDVMGATSDLEIHHQGAILEFALLSAAGTGCGMLGKSAGKCKADAVDRLASSSYSQPHVALPCTHGH